MPQDKAAGHPAQITADPKVLGGKPAIAGTRIAVEHILEQLADNPDLTEFFEVYPDLTVDDVRAALEYARALVAGETTLPRFRVRPSASSTSRLT